MDSEQAINVKPVEYDSPRIKPAPQTSKIIAPFLYFPSHDGTDENLLILLHGLGDTHVPFAKLGRSFKLAQTAILSLQAPELVPYLYEEAYQWYPSFDQLGDRLERPNPSTALEYMMRVLGHLVDDCRWHPDRIHLFGYAQGGSVAAELALKWWKSQHQEGKATALASVMSISGPLLSYPTTKDAERSPTPILVFRRSGDTECKQDDVTALKKGFMKVEEVHVGAVRQGMPQSKDEWMPIMRFWSSVLSRREVGDIFQVI